MTGDEIKNGGGSGDNPESLPKNYRCILEKDFAVLQSQIRNMTLLVAKMNAKLEPLVTKIAVNDERWRTHDIEHGELRKGARMTDAGNFLFAAIAAAVSYVFGK